MNRAPSPPDWGLARPSTGNRHAAAQCNLFGRNTRPVPRPNAERSYLYGSRRPSGRNSVLASAQDQTALHQYSQIPGIGDFLPKFLPEQAQPLS